ncbi:MAG: D-aminoacyl-tRNA deacylase [bacterium]|nr:D-aminoacyl-tRNA deacylase [bacterium]
MFLSMRFLIQSVQEAQVTTKKKTESIQQGLLIYVAISRDD